MGRRPVYRPSAHGMVSLHTHAARRTRHQIVLLFVVDCPVTDYENEDDQEEEGFSLASTIWRGVITSRE